MINQSLWLCCCLLLLSLQSCRKKTIPQNSTESDKVTIQKFKFNVCQGKGKINYTHGDYVMQNIAINIRMKKDSVVWMNLSSSGISAARLLINQDSIYLINFIEKTYNTFDYSTLAQRFGFKINYATIQALLLGNPIIGPSSTDNHTTQKQPDHVVVNQVTDHLNIVSHVLTSTQKIDQIELYAPLSSSSLNIAYSQFQRIDDQLFPKKSELELHYNALGKKDDYKITITYSVVKKDYGDIKFPFRIPKRYDRK